MSSSFLRNLFVVFLLVGTFCSNKFQLCYASESESSDSKFINSLNNENIYSAHLKYDDGSWKPLHEVVIYGSEADVQELLNNGANVNLVNGEKMTALHVAVFYGYENFVNLLLKNGVNINSVNIFGKSALHMAAERGNERIVTLLVRNGANIDIVDADGFTALEYAVKKGYTNVADIIKESIITTTQTIPLNIKTTRIFLVAHPRTTVKPLIAARRSFFESVWNEVKENQLTTPFSTKKRS